MTVTPAEAARDLRKHASAIKSALAAHSPPLPAFDLDEVDLSGGPDIYAIVHVSHRFTTEGLRVGGHYSLPTFRLLLRFVGTTVGEVQWADWVATRALEEKSLTVATASGDQQTSPLVFEGVTDLPRQEDDGELYIAAKEFIYTV